MSTAMMQSRVSTQYASTSSSRNATNKIAFRHQQPRNISAFNRRHHQQQQYRQQQQQHKRRNGSVVVNAGLVEKMNAEQLEVAMADRSTPIVIDFYATWCGPLSLIHI